MSARPLSEYKKDISQGIWFFLHTMGEAAKTPELMKAYSHFFHNICNKMGCSCENHCIKMLNDHPPEHYFSMVDQDGVPCGCFYHSVMCHNMVNQRLGKPTYTYDQIYPLFRGSEATTVVKPCSAPSSEATSVPPSLTGSNPVPLRRLNTSQESRQKLSVSKRRRAGIRIMNA